MIINIPLQVDEKKMEEVIAKDYEQKVINEITDYIKSALANRSGRYHGDRVKDGMDNLITYRIDTFLKEHTDEIIETAGNALADRLVRTKRGKALIDEISEVKQ